MPATCRAPAASLINGTRHGDPDRHQQLHAAARRCRAASCTATRTSLQGNILNNAAVVFNQTGNGTYAGTMSGTGGMTLQGGGVLTITGTNTYTGPTTVNASTLVVNGSLASTVTLNNGGMLGGNGIDRRARRPTAASWRPATRSARSTSTATSPRTAAPTSSRPMPRARATASTSPAPPPSTAPRCRCWPRPATTRQHDLHHPQRHRRRQRAPTRASPATSPS